MAEGIKENGADARIVYADIIHHPHHQSASRPHMSLYSRAAQFSSFDALAGYSDMVVEEARLTDERATLDESRVAVLDYSLRQMNERILDAGVCEASITYFVPDGKKAGGSFQTYTGGIRAIDLTRRELRTSDGRGIRIEDITEIEPEL